MSRARCAIAFDIDGVLQRSPNVFPFTKPTLNRVMEKQIPFVFVTNGGGYSERIKMKHINERLDMNLDHSRLILCHTPLKQHMQHIKDELILVSGNRDVYNVALEYGFSNAISAGEIVTAHPQSYPFLSPHKDLPLDASRRHNPNILEYDARNVSAIAILNDGLCWGSELQIMMDALIYGKKMNGNDHPLFYCTNPDLVWSTAYKYPRVAQGIYAGMVMDTYKRMTGKTLNVMQFGKPTKNTFDYAESVLMDEAHKLGYNEIEEVYMIGDNPQGDIVGGNNKGWKTILVKSGIYQEGLMDPGNPTVIHENVQDAVDWILRQHSL